MKSAAERICFHAESRSPRGRTRESTALLLMCLAAASACSDSDPAPSVDAQDSGADVTMVAGRIYL